ncbi:putative endonuclease [Halpernia humi]|uniref:Putative endonuclease n=1 Tax=Halpernia humi TaxID=493375 RepID=A0A1H5TST1_9FLAO|nr:GIY-YIG nuclease family protein [Halpernia humi]SEF65829.1 putative endonuclease [Halpernia humi]
MNEFVVYVLYSEKYDKYYTGFTSSLIERFYSHNNFSNKGFTKKFRPWIVVYVEFFESKIEALNREKYLKSGHGRNYLKLILKK